MVVCAGAKPSAGVWFSRRARQSGAVSCAGGTHRNGSLAAWRLCNSLTMFRNSPRARLASSLTQQKTAVVLLAKACEPSWFCLPIEHNPLLFITMRLRFCARALLLLKCGMCRAQYSLCAVAFTLFLPELRCLCLQAFGVQRSHFRPVFCGRFSEGRRCLRLSWLALIAPAKPSRKSRPVGSKALRQRVVGREKANYWMVARKRTTVE